MKAMILGATAYIENGLSMVNGLQNLGIESGFFDYRIFLQKYGQDELKHTIFSLLKIHKPEWIFCQYQHNPFPFDWFGEMKLINPDSKISLMSVDMRNNLDDATVAAGKYVDVCFQKGRQEYYLSQGLNCHILQEGYTDLLFYKQEQEDPKVLDIVFAGGFYPTFQFPATQERVDILNYLCCKFDKIKVFGTGWENKLPSSCFGGFIELPQINDIYNSSKIVLNINHYNDIEHYWSIRMIEGMASGSMMLTKYVPGLEKYFKNFEDLVWFYSLCDCVRLLEYYLTYDDERELIAEKGRLSVQRDFRWESVMKKAHNVIFGSNKHF
jgi:hypothetical protein